MTVACPGCSHPAGLSNANLDGNVRHAIDLHTNEKVLEALVCAAVAPSIARAAKRTAKKGA
jgi:hypothetical protein